VYPQSNGCCSQQRCCFKYEWDKNIWNVFEQREALAQRVSAMDGSEYKNIWNVFEQREALAQRVSAMDGSE
jgi:hypothetical protein